MATFTRKHYERVAEILHEEKLRPSAHKPTIAGIFNKFVKMFKRDNPRFDYDRFFNAVWVTLDD